MVCIYRNLYITQTHITKFLQSLYNKKRYSSTKINLITSAYIGYNVVYETNQIHPHKEISFLNFIIFSYYRGLLKTVHFKPLYYILL